LTADFAIHPRSVKGRPNAGIEQLRIAVRSGVRPVPVGVLAGLLDRLDDRKGAPRRRPARPLRDAFGGNESDPR
jgi:hypothetical protein